MTIEQAITKSIEAGYLAEDIRGRKTKVKVNGDFFVIQAGNFEMTVPESMYFLDPSFWQSLGKAMGWSDEVGKECLRPNCGNCAFGGTHMAGVGRIQWKEEWHRLIDHLSEGKTAEQYFKTLA